MSNKQTRKLRVKVALWCVAVAIPFLFAVWVAWLTKAGEVGVLLVAAWVFCLEIIAADHEWKLGWARRVASNSVVRVSAIVVTFSATGWFAHVVHKPGVIDPEATQNKYVRIRKIASPDGRFSHAILLEFGVVKWSSEGIAVVVPFRGDKWDDWWGEPGRTDEQDEETGVLELPQPPAVNGRLRLRYPTFPVTPRKSYYLCIMSLVTELQEPNDILFFAVTQNEKALSPARERLGHQYQRR